MESWQENLARCLVVGWIPIVILTLSADPSALLSLLGSYAINSRMLIAVPVLLAGQPLMESIFLRIGRHITDADLLSPSDSEQLNRPLRSSAGGVILPSRNRYRGNRL